MPLGRQSVGSFVERATLMGWALFFVGGHDDEQNDSNRGSGVGIAYKHN